MRSPQIPTQLVVYSSVATIRIQNARGSSIDQQNEYSGVRFQSKYPLKFNTSNSLGYQKVGINFDNISAENFTLLYTCTVETRSQLTVQST